MSAVFTFTCVIDCGKNEADVSVDKFALLVLALASTKLGFAPPTSLIN